jgi:hypothetical protein
MAIKCACIKLMTFLWQPTCKSDKVSWILVRRTPSLPDLFRRHCCMPHYPPYGKGCTSSHVTHSTRLPIQQLDQQYSLFPIMNSWYYVYLQYQVCCCLSDFPTKAGHALLISPVQGAICLAILREMHGFWNFSGGQSCMIYLPEWGWYPNQKWPHFAQGQIQGWPFN